MKVVNAGRFATQEWSCANALQCCFFAALLLYNVTGPERCCLPRGGCTTTSRCALGASG